MSSTDVPGYTLRSVAAKQFGRSKSSFLRDVDRAFQNNDVEFLKHFRVYLNDETFIEGPDATKAKISSLQNKQPRSYIETAFLETRYWEKDNEPQPRKKEKANSEAASEDRGLESALTDASPLTQLQHELALEKQRSRAKDEKITTLETTNQFLKEELEHRRGDMKELTELVQAMRKALPESQSTSQQYASRPSERPTADHSQSADRVNVIDAPIASASPKKGTANAKKTARHKRSTASSKSTTAPKKSRQTTPPKRVTWTDKHLPTLKQWFSK